MVPYHAIIGKANGKTREQEDAMDIKYTEVPGATLVTMMVVCWLAVLFAGTIGAILA